MNIAVTPPAEPHEPNVDLALKDAREQVMKETGAIPTGERAGSKKVYVAGELPPPLPPPLPPGAGPPPCLSGGGGGPPAGRPRRC